MSAQTRAPEAVQELFATELSIVIDAHPEAIFDYISDIARHPEWAANPLDVRHVSGPASGVGATYASVARRIARIAGTSTGSVRMLTLEPPHRLVYEVNDTTGRYYWTMTLTPEAHGTRLTQRMAKLSGPWFINIVQPWMIWPLVGSQQVQGGLQNIKMRMEAKR